MRNQIMQTPAPNYISAIVWILTIVLWVLCLPLFCYIVEVSRRAEKKKGKQSDEQSDEQSEEYQNALKTWRGK
jgi:cytochrome c-type biogenesis protein CcmH/NrfF